jgi:hypothetical protein
MPESNSYWAQASQVSQSSGCLASLPSGLRASTIRVSWAPRLRAYWAPRLRAYWPPQPPASGAPILQAPIRSSAGQPIYEALGPCLRSSPPGRREGQRHLQASRRRFQASSRHPEVEKCTKSRSYVEYEQRVRTYAEAICGPGHLRTPGPSGRQTEGGPANPGPNERAAGPGTP